MLWEARNASVSKYIFPTINKQENSIKILLNFEKKLKGMWKQNGMIFWKEFVSNAFKKYQWTDKTVFIHWLQIALILYFVGDADPTPSRDHQYY